jgi:hypothetical protein
MSSLGWGILANLTTVVLLAVLVGIIHWMTRRRKVKRFLHVKSRGIVVYASRIVVVSGGAVGTDGRNRSFSGPSVSETELSSMIHIEAFLSSLRPTSEFLSGSLNRLRVLWRDTTVNVRLAPKDESGIDQTSTVISIGSPAYNIVSAVIERDNPRLARFQDDNREIAIPGVGASREVDAFIVERVVNRNLNQCRFYLAGQSSLGTATAVGYLISHWTELHKRFPQDVSFSLVLDGHFRDDHEPELLFESPPLSHGAGNASQHPLTPDVGVMGARRVEARAASAEAQAGDPTS